MPPKQNNKYLTHFQEFVEYSAQAFRHADNMTLAAGRTSGRGQWLRTSRNNAAAKDEYCAALDAKRVEQEKVEKQEAEALPLQQDIDELMQRNVRTRDNESLFRKWSALHECHQKLVNCHNDLVASSARLTTAIDAIYTGDRMKAYSALKHAEVVKARQRARDTWFATEDLEDQFGIPETQHGRRKILEDWLPLFKKQGAAERRARRFLREIIPSDHDQDPDVWVGGWPMPAQGGHSMTAIYVKVDPNEHIVSRMVLKNVRRDVGNWDATQWQYPNIGMRNAEYMRPMEVVCNDEVGRVQSVRFNQHVDVTQVCGCYVDPKDLAYTVYLDYCDYGDLHSLCNRYIARGEHIPEPFLWRLFLSLAVTGLAMEKGTVIPDEINEDWPLGIVHRDLKPTNVFLDDPTPGHFETYPTPRVGDFGIAIKTYKDDALNPTIFLKFLGTHRYSAPEQKAYANLRDAKPVHRFKQLAWTNVYGIGLIMYTLITLTEPPQIQWWGDGAAEELDLYEANHQPVVSNYSPTLIDLLQGCLCFDPRRRNNFEQLLVDIEHAIWVEARDHGRKDGDIADPDLLDQDDLLYERDNYASAMSLRDLPAL